MKEQEYIKAPVSEVIFGITFKDPYLLENGQLYRLLAELQQRPASMELSGPIGDEVFDLNGRSLEINPLVTGPVLYRFRNKEEPYLIQLQHNKLVLNWVRPDDHSVGQYPGYREIRPRFDELLAAATGDSLDWDRVKYLELGYQDRLPVDDLGRSINELQESLGWKSPELSLPGRQEALFHYSTHEIKDPPAHLSLALRTLRNREGKWMFSMYSGLFSNTNEPELSWFDAARTTQRAVFDSVFPFEVREKWRG